MAGRPGDWGAKLAELRKRAGLSAADVVKELRALGVELNSASIYTYEAGRVSSPAAAVIWGLAQVYGVNLEDLVRILVDPRATSRLAGPDRSTHLRLSLEERNAVNRLRQLSPAARKAVLEFLDFQLQHMRPKKGRPKGE